MQFLCIGSLQDACHERAYCEQEGVPIRHYLPNGNTIWETHGSRDGQLSWDGKGYQSGDWVIACYPARQRENMQFALPEHDGVVICGYDWYEQNPYEAYLVNVREQ